MTALEPDEATVTSTSPPDQAVFDPTRPYRLHPQVALRPESFGAMAYHYGNRRLNFLRHRDLVAVVEQLGEHPSVDATLAAVGVDEARWPAFHRALARLSSSAFLEPQSESPS